MQKEKSKILNIRKNYTAVFVEEVENQKEKGTKGPRLYFKDVRNENGLTIKDNFWIYKKHFKRERLELKKNDILYFSADMEIVPNYQDGFKLINPRILKII